MPSRTDIVFVSFAATMGFALGGSLVSLPESVLDILWDMLLDKPGEFLTAVATLLLVAVTLLLFIATRALAQTARTESESRKLLATVDAWMKVRSKVDLPDLTEVKNLHERVPNRTKIIRQLRELEAFAAVANDKEFDLKLFDRISGAWFLRQFRNIQPYLALQSNAYEELNKLAEAIATKRGQINLAQDTASGKPIADDPWFKRKTTALGPNAVPPKDGQTLTEKQRPPGAP